MGHQQRVRAVILRHLAALENDLGQFEQTCHGRLGLGDEPWKQLGYELGLVGEQPSAYNISNLAQLIGLILKACGWKKHVPEPVELKVHEVNAEPQTIHDAVYMAEELARRAINRIEHEVINRTGYHPCSFAMGINVSGNIELKMRMTNAPYEAHAQLPDGTNIKISTSHLEPTGPVLRHSETGDVIPCLEQPKAV
jgi:hypothetical protein